MHDVPSKRNNPLTHRQNPAFQKIGILSGIALSTPNLTKFGRTNYEVEQTKIFRNVWDTRNVPDGLEYRNGNLESRVVWEALYSSL
jgi:hypothetical protein